MRQTETKAWLSPEEFSTIFDRSIGSTYAQIRKREIPAIKVGQRLKIPLSYVHELERRALESVVA
jgi:hypothetical protein